MDNLTKKLTEENLEYVSGGKSSAPYRGHPGSQPGGIMVIYSVLRCKHCDSELDRVIKQENGEGCRIPPCCPYCLEKKGIITNDYYAIDEEAYL